MTRTCPRCKKEMVYKNALYYHRAVKANSVCNTCGQFVRYRKTPTQPIMSVSQYEFLGVTQVDVGRDTNISLQVIRFPCPQCQTEVIKRVPPDGWDLKATCMECGNGYTCAVKPANLPVTQNNFNETQSWAICIK